MTPGSETFPFAVQPLRGQRASCGRCGDCSEVPLPSPRFRSQTCPTQLPVETEAPWAKVGSRSSGCRDGGQAGSLDQLREAHVGKSGLLCTSVQPGRKQAGKQMPSDSWEESAGKLQWWQEAGSPPHPVILLGGSLWFWCPVLWDGTVLDGAGGGNIGKMPLGCNLQ